MQEEKTAENEQEFELIPISPLRRLERRIDEVERKSQHFDSKEFYKELVDIIRMNQQIVDEMAKANDALRIELSKLPSRMEQTLARLDELVAFIKASAGDEGGEVGGASGMQPVVEQLAAIAETNKKILETNQALLSATEDLQKKMKRPALPAPPMRRPIIFPAKPNPV
jgi:regulator of replication initiation timing